MTGNDRCPEAVSPRILQKHPLGHGGSQSDGNAQGIQCFTSLEVGQPTLTLECRKLSDSRYNRNSRV